MDIGELDHSTFDVLKHQFNIISADAFKEVCLYKANVLQKIVLLTMYSLRFKMSDALANCTYIKE